jgi:uncharacterized membrane protein YfcA
MPETSILLAGVLVCFLGGILGGLSGAGTGIVVAGFLTPIIGAKAVMPALAVIMVINNGSRVFYYRHSVQGKVALLMTALALPGTWFGTQLYMDLSARTLEIVLGAAILAILVYQLAKRKLHAPTPSGAVSKKVYWLGGPISLLYGFLNSMVPGSGVMILAFLTAIGMTASAIISTDAVISLVLNVGKIIMFRSLDGLPNSLILISIACGIASVPGVWFAKWISTRLRQNTQRWIIELVIALSAIHILWRAL